MCLDAVAAPHACCLIKGGAPRRRSTRRGPGGRGGSMEALRGCPPSARPPRPASAARQPNVNLGATRARTRPATRRAPLRPVWRHGRRWRGERRPSWSWGADWLLFDGIARRQEVRLPEQHPCDPTRARTGRRARDGSPEARGIALTSTLGLPPKLAKKAARRARRRLLPRGLPPGDAPPGELGNTTQVLPHN